MTAKYLTKKQAAEMLQVSQRQVQKWIAEGSLKSHRLGHRTLRIEAADLQSFVKAKQ